MEKIKSWGPQVGITLVLFFWVAFSCLGSGCSGKGGSINSSSDASVADGDNFTETCNSQQPNLPSDENCNCRCLDCNCETIQCICEDRCYQQDCLISVDSQGNAHTEDPLLKTCDLDCVGGDTDDNPKMICTVVNCEGLQPCACHELKSTSLGVENNGQGGLTLVSNPVNPAKTYSFIWVANSAEGTVSKIDTTSGEELGRYRTGPTNASDPSRTTVGLDGDVVVANRSGDSAIRIHADAKTCIDKNQNGTIETSSGPNQVLPWGQDECVLWYHAFDPGSMPRAAAYEFFYDADGTSSRVWIGLFTLQKMVRLDARNGEVLDEVDIPGNPYGAALDRSGNLWIVGSGSSVIQLNTQTLVAKSISSTPTECLYGITVDSSDRVWISGGGCVARYEPNQDKWTKVQTGAGDPNGWSFGFNRGLAADGKGSVWVADTNYGVHQVDAESVQVLKDLPMGDGNQGWGLGIIGMAVDFNGKIWAIDQLGSRAVRIDSATLQYQSFPTGSNPYTYSDMTGVQLYNVAPPSGSHTSLIEGCDSSQNWLRLSWSADTPIGTSIQFAARVAGSEAELQAKPFSQVARQPGDQSPVDISAALGGAVNSTGKLMELEITLHTENEDLLPVLQNVQIASSGCQQPASLSLKVE